MVEVIVETRIQDLDIEIMGAEGQDRGSIIEIGMKLAGEMRDTIIQINLFKYNAEMILPVVRNTP